MTIADPLTRAVIGVAATAPGIEHVEALGIEQFGGVGAGPGSEQRRVLEQPDQLACIVLADRAARASISASASAYGVRPGLTRHSIPSIGSMMRRAMAVRSVKGKIALACAATHNDR